MNKFMWNVDDGHEPTAQLSLQLANHGPGTHSQSASITDSL